MMRVGSPAAAGFSTAARFWESVITNDVKVNLNVSFENLNSGFLAQTSSSTSLLDIRSVEERMRANGTSALDAKISASGLPTLDGNGALTVTTPSDVDSVNKLGVDTPTQVLDADGSFNNRFIGVTNANAKALGYLFDANIVDATIEFNSIFPFDFDARDGISAFTFDFLGAAIHEIGHALGFLSGVDDYDTVGCPRGPACDQFADFAVNDDFEGNALDLFRYDEAQIDWRPVTSYFSTDGGVTRLNGNGLLSSGLYHGDQRQASHWRANGTCSDASGIMAPALCNGSGGIVTGTDLAASDAIGWNLTLNALANPNLVLSTAQIASTATISESNSWSFMLVGLLLIGWQRWPRMERIGAKPVFL